ncbi:MAG: hypothetical protein K2Y37_15405 [Pirellulales bacterium]|nr:hypothetical protein [Pirellulales bacterium]
MSASDSITFGAARNHAGHYGSVYYDRSLQETREADDCGDCEAFLQLGIDAAQWYLRADREQRLIAYQRGEDIDPETQATVEKWFRDWLVPCDFAERWVARIEAQGRSPSNLQAFRAICEEIRAIVEFLDGAVDRELPKGLIPLRDKAAEEQRHGQTSEFV